MGAGYTFIAGILLYIFLLQKLDSPTMNPVKAATIFALGYLALQSISMGLYCYAAKLPLLPNLVNTSVALTILFQFAAAGVAFYKVDQSGDEYLSYALWGGIGLAVIFFVVPAVV